MLTQRVYGHNVNHFLGFMANEYPEKKTQLSDAWDYDAGKRFLESISEMVAPSTTLGYHNALACFSPAKATSHLITSRLIRFFSVLARGASTKRTRYIKSTKLAKANKFKLLGNFYREVYHSQENWKWYADLVKSC